MAHFYGSVKGQKGEGTRLGSKSSGLQVYAAAWQGAVYVGLYHNAKTGQDMATVSLVPWHGSGASRTLYVGPVSGGEDK